MWQDDAARHPPLALGIAALCTLLPPSKREARPLHSAPCQQVVTAHVPALSRCARAWSVGATRSGQKKTMHVLAQQAFVNSSYPSGVTAQEWQIRACKRSPLSAFHTLAVPSYDAEATSMPSGEKAAPRTQSVCPVSVCRHSPLDTHHTLTVPSYDADAIRAPSGEKTAARTQSSCPASMNMHSPDSVEKRPTFLLAEAMTIVWPSGEKAAAFAMPFSAIRATMLSPVAVRQTRTVPSMEVVSALPRSGERTAPVSGFA
mmetsp:Transcript_10665/g.29552  ORF Transcript_10665/g.29552 Transcript_10665/m.29552 type:complete len:259 (+) Transcript_10665:284-1060(+)